jgi:hypothetical protein
MTTINEAYVMGTEAAFNNEGRDVPQYIRDEALVSAWLNGYDNEISRLEGDDPESDFDDLEAEQGEYYRDDNFRDDVEADADVLRMAGWGTDEDYGYFDSETW